ncbi:Imm49 family immunity protein [Pseudoalteromonas phenolica]|uniref:Imm49 family immunity protein n=1 Tax=Pseudoalteromonas phenolica TaxID=161398 RepID=UPI0014870FEB|nr:Imm49 family immunity protein [Pseudoalteromonas phenolica]
MAKITGTLRSGDPFNKVVTKRTKKLDLSDFEISKLDLQPLSEADNLSTLTFADTPLDADFAALAQCVHLQTLSVKVSTNACPMLSQTAIKHLTLSCEQAHNHLTQSLPESLTSLTLNVEDDGPLDLSQLPSSLMHLTINGPLTHIDLQPLAQHSLTSLTLSELKASNIDLPSDGLTHLLSFALLDCETQVFFTNALYKSTQLKVADFTGSVWDALYYDGLYELPSLEQISIDDTTRVYIDAPGGVVRPNIQLTTQSKKSSKTKPARQVKIKITPLKYKDIDILRWQLATSNEDDLEYINKRIGAGALKHPILALQAIGKAYTSIALCSCQQYQTFKESHFKENIIKNLLLANQCNHIAQQGRILPQGVTQTYTLDKVDYTLSGTDPSTWPYRNEYTQQLSLALVMRDTACVNTLMSYTPSIASEHRGRLELEQGAYIEYMHSVIRDDVDHMAVHNKVMPLIEEVIPYSHHWELDLWHALGKLQQDRDLAAFELAVVESFTQHMQKQKKDRQLPDHYMPFLLLAPVCMAYDKFAYRPQHHNEYLPEWLISGRFDLPA